MGGNKGGSQTTTSKQQSDSSTRLPDWLDAGSQQAIQRATDLSNNTATPYYTGEQVAGQSPLTQQAYNQILAQQGSANPAFAQAAGAWGNLIGQATPQTAGEINDFSNQLYGNYQQNVMNPAQGLLGGYLQGGPATAQQVGSNAQQLMSPYAQSVINPMIQAGEQQREIARQQIAGQANNVGAFGGSRQGVAEGASDAAIQLGTQQQIGNLLNQGWGQALQPAYGLASQAGQQGYNAATGLAGMGQAGYQSAQAAGQGLANQNLAAGLLSAQQLPGQAVTQANLNQQQTAGLQAAGTSQQQYQQQLIDEQMGNWAAQYQQPYQNLYTLLGSLGSVPYGTTSTSQGYGQNTAKTDPGLLNTIGAYVGMASKLASTAGSFAKGGA
jgi:hypothetical protein